MAMLTYLEIDTELLDRAVAVGSGRTMQAVVTTALQEFIASREQQRWVDLTGQLEWDGSFDHKAERSRS